MELEIQAKSNL